MSMAQVRVRATAGCVHYRHARRAVVQGKRSALFDDKIAALSQLLGVCNLSKPSIRTPIVQTPLRPTSPSSPLAKTILRAFKVTTDYMQACMPYAHDDSGRSEYWRSPDMTGYLAAVSKVLSALWLRSTWSQKVSHQYYTLTPPVYAHSHSYTNDVTARLLKKIDQHE